MLDSDLPRFEGRTRAPRSPSARAGAQPWSIFLDWAFRRKRSAFASSTVRKGSSSGNGLPASRRQSSCVERRRVCLEASWASRPVHCPRGRMPAGPDRLCRHVHQHAASEGGLEGDAEQEQIATTRAACVRSCPPVSDGRGRAYRTMISALPSLSAAITTMANRQAAGDDLRGIYFYRSVYVGDMLLATVRRKTSCVSKRFLQRSLSGRA